MKSFAVFLVVIAGTMWAGSGLAAQHFLAHNDYTAMDLTVFRMISTALIIFVIAFMRGTLGRSMRILKEYPTLWIKLIFYGLGLMLMQHTYFAGIGAGNAAVATVIQYICPALVICWVALRRKKVPGMGDMFAVVLAVGGVFLLATGGDPRTLSVPAECIYYSVLSAVFYAFCSIYPKQLMMTLDNSFLFMFGMLFGGIMGYMADPVTDLGTFFHDDVLFDIFMIIICGTVIAFICYNAGLAWLTEEQTSVTATVEPAVSVIASYFLFGTTFGLFEGTGIIMVLLAILMPVMRKWHGN